jgi:hypothetical protein
MPIEHDFYKLMQLEPYVDIVVVKKRYRDLAKIYHPDKHPNTPHAEDYFKVITQGYDLLSDPELKNIYDEALKQYYGLPKHQNAPADKWQVAQEKVKKHLALRRSQLIEAYEKDEAFLSHKLRFIAVVLLSISGLLMCYNHWFVNLLNYKILYNVLGGFMFCSGAYWASSLYYKKQSYHLAIRDLPYQNNAAGIRLFLILFAVIPFLFLGLMKFTKYVHLNHFYGYAEVKKINAFGDELAYYYEVNGELIMRRCAALPKAAFHESRLQVKFSLINPYISELVYFIPPTP